MAEPIKDRILRLERDTERGASELAGMGLEILRDAAIAAGPDGQTAYSGTLETARRIASARPSMAPLGNWAAFFMACFKELLERNPGPSAEAAARGAAKKALAEKARMAGAQVEAARQALGAARSVMTLSYSSTVEKILMEAAMPRISITVAESRPLLEGRKTFDRLARAGRRVRMVTDAQMGLAVIEAEAVLIGADAVCADLAVVNKTGSLLAALAAKQKGKPFLAAADTFKIAPYFNGDDTPLEEHDGGEVWREHPKSCSNIYFEPVPAELVTVYLTEKGPLDAGAMAGQIESVRALRAEVFGDSPV